MRILRCGERAALVEVDSLEQVLGLFQALRAKPPAGVVELVPAARTVLVGYDPAEADFTALSAELRRYPVTATAGAGAGELTLPVRYDGEDLPGVADATGLSVREVVRRHTAATYTVAFCGFAPGFGYLTGLDRELQLPRLDSPRTTVPGGAVAIAGEYTGVYPGPSPGGWRIIGHTDEVMWDVDRDPPGLFTPGLTVRFTEWAR